ncbi:hypothetical protein F4774DRAFT_407624 [Daldinia eschscholtzii]|nr:hypothetical protein F4774DRAFT_407624 [Daldinia eschscholtzii]
MPFSKEQMMGFDFDYSGLEMVATSDSSAHNDRLNELEKRNEELVRQNAELMAFFKSIKEDMRTVKESMETAQEELQSARTHNARLQGELSSLTKRKRAAARTKTSELERFQAAEIDRLKQELAQSKLERLAVTPSDTASMTSAGDLTTIFDDSSASGQLSYGSGESSRPAKRRHVESLQDWNENLDMFQFNAGPANPANDFLGPAFQSEQARRPAMPTQAQSFSGQVEVQNNTNHQLSSYGQDQVYGQYNQMPWGNGMPMNPQLQPQQGHGMPSYPKLPQGNHWSF